ncbi:hypothetical protein V1511DRAFT_509302 [Dipodascopsis uninucleata]
MRPVLSSTCPTTLGRDMLPSSSTTGSYKVYRSPITPQLSAKERPIILPLTHANLAKIPRCENRVQEYISKCVTPRLNSPGKGIGSTGSSEFKNFMEDFALESPAKADSKSSLVMNEYVDFIRDRYFYDLISEFSTIENLSYWDIELFLKFLRLLRRDVHTSKWSDRYMVAFAAQAVKSKRSSVQALLMTKEYTENSGYESVYRCKIHQYKPEKCSADCRFKEATRLENKDSFKKSGLLKSLTKTLHSKMFKRGISAYAVEHGDYPEAGSLFTQDVPDHENHHQ